jgi:hypothetical protein
VIVDRAPPGAHDAAFRCARCVEVHQDLEAGRQLRIWRERGSVFTDQQASDVVTVHVGGLDIHVWLHPDGALIEGVDRDPGRHAAFVSICRDPEEAGARAVFLATSHGSRCLERPAWPVMHVAVEVTSVVGE